MINYKIKGGFLTTVSSWEFSEIKPLFFVDLGLLALLIALSYVLIFDNEAYFSVYILCLFSLARIP